MEKKTMLWIGGFILILVLVFASIQINKSNNQREVDEQKLELQEKEINFKMEQELKAEADKAYAKIMIRACIEDAEDAYWNYAELNGTGKRDDEKGVFMDGYKWDRAEENKKDDIDECYRKYSN